MTRFWTRSLVTLCAATSLTLAGPNSECPVLPDPIPLVLDQVLTLAEHSFIVHASGVQNSSGGPVVGLEIELQAGLTDLHRGGVRVGSFLPGLRVGYRLHGRDGAISTGRLPLGLTPRGPAYHGLVPLEPALDSDRSESLSLNLEISGPQIEEPLHPEHGGEECPVPNFPSNVEVTFDVQELLRHLELGPPDGPGIDADPVRMTLLSHRDPVEPSNYSNIWGWNNGSTYIAIVGNVPGTTFFDVTDPSNPVQVGFIDGPDSSWREIKTYKNYAYIVTEGSGPGEGLQIVDLTNPLAPTLVNTYAVNFNTAHTLFIDEVVGRAYINGTNLNGNASGMRILDLEPNPTQPVEVGVWTPRYVHDNYVGNNRAFLSEIYDGLQEVYDASNPANLTPIASWTTPNAFTHNCWANRDQTILVTTDETTNPPGFLAVYDISNLASGAALLGRYVGEAGATVHNAYFDDQGDTRVAASYYGAGGHLIDLRRPQMPVRLGSYDTYPSGTNGFVGAWGIYPFDPRGYLYVSDIQTGFYLLRYDPTGGVVSGRVRDAGSLQPISGVKVFDLAGGESVITGNDGIYSLYAAAGSVTLRLTAPGYSSNIVHAGNLTLNGYLDIDATMTALPRGGLSGRVRRSDTLAGIPAALVQVPALGLTTITSADGSFSFSSTPVGGHVITAEVFGFSSGEARVSLSTSGVSGLNIDLETARFVDDAETNQGWSLGGQVGDGATSGVWTRVDPNGTLGGQIQPEDDHTAAPGVLAFITGQSAVGAQPEVGDVDGGRTTLVTPTINTSDLGAAQVRYWRWVASNGGFFSGGSMAIESTSDNGASWTPVDSLTTTNAGWQRATFNLGSFSTLSNTNRVRFQARPNTPYAQSVLECGVDDFDLVRACNPRFNPAVADADGDSNADPCDSCSLDGGNDQDGDGVCGDLDNAPRNANASQVDLDADGVGDAGDNCVSVANNAQRDLDRDGQGDACDADLDGDTVANLSDSDDDNDGVLDLSDNCIDAANALQLDRDRDNLGDTCDEDDDEVGGVRWRAGQLEWEREVGATGYNLYRGDLGAPALLPLAACRIANLRTRYASDLELPTPGDGFFYLVSHRDSGGEGALGKRSSGAERQITTRCP